MPLWLLKAFGFFSPLKKVPLTVWLWVFIAVPVLFFSWRVAEAYKEHQEYVQALETSNTQLKGRNTRLQEQVDSLLDINEQNRKTYQESLRQAQEARRIAEEERREAEQRANQYRSIRDAAKATPQQDRQPVSPVVRDTIDRLWDNPGTGDAARHP